jgi:DNA adenine methylase
MTIKVKKQSNTSYQPFIKWVGGKRGLLPDIISSLPKNFNNYFEPFLGGGAVFFELYNRGLLDNKQIYLSDINEELINTYNTIKCTPIELIKNLKVLKEKHNKDFYYKTRELDRKETFKKMSNIDRATRFIYLNKTCFNGLYRVNKKGFFNTPMGGYTNPNIADETTILNASEALQNATISNCDFNNFSKNTHKGDLVYFDPPYHPLTESSNFTAYNESSFLEEEQFKLYELFENLSEREIKIIKSNSDTKFINELYKKFFIHTVEARRSINSKGNKRGKVNEIIIRNFND